MAFSECQALYQILGTVLRDWPTQNVDPELDLEPVIRIRKVEDRYERNSLWLAKPAIFRDEVDTVCDFIVDLIHTYVSENENCLCLHGAAVEFEAGLIVFPSTYRAGKSTLSVQLVSSGARLFSDDVLPINQLDNQGIALGILPRLRLPIPETTGQTLKDFIDHRSGPQNDRYHYICLDENELAIRGTQAPVTAIAVLQRSPHDKPSLQPAKKSDVVRDMILRNFARQNSAIDIVDRLHAIVDQAECYTLAYDTLDQATELLEEIFGITPFR